MIEVGQKAPDFSLPDQDGEHVRLSSFLGKTVVVYFYPKDDTPGCTKEACSIRDSFPTISDRNTVILGVSPDTAESHRAFQEKYGLPFTLLSDVDHSVMTEWGAYGTKKMYGKEVVGVIRSTFVIDDSGVVKKVFKRVDTARHGEQLLNVI